MIAITLRRTRAKPRAIKASHGIKSGGRRRREEYDMSVEFRQRTAKDLILMLKRRKWLILMPVLTMAVAVGYVVQKLPSIYESRTLLIVKPPRISERVAQSLSDEDLT